MFTACGMAIVLIIVGVVSLLPSCEHKGARTLNFTETRPVEVER